MSDQTVLADRVLSAIGVGLLAVAALHLHVFGQIYLSWLINDVKALIDDGHRAFMHSGIVEALKAKFATHGGYPTMSKVAKIATWLNDHWQTISR
jgi:hypothetical protein